MRACGGCQAALVLLMRVCLCGRPRALRHPAENMRIKRTRRRVPNARQRRFFPTPAGKRAAEPRGDPPAITRAQHKGTRLVPHIPARAGRKQALSRDIRRLFTRDRRTRGDIYLPSGVPMRFVLDDTVCRSRAVRSSSPPRYLTECSRKNAITETQAAGPPLRAPPLWLWARGAFAAEPGCEREIVWWDIYYSQTVSAATT